MRFIPEIKRALILAQQDYSRVWFEDQKDNQVKQYYPDLSAVAKDQQRAIEMCQFLDFDESGLDKVQILNKDLVKDSVTKKQLDLIFRALS